MDKFIKEIIDIVFPIIILILFLPIILIIIIVILLDSGFPIFFKQQRPGLNEKSFLLLKFRTMIDTYNDNGELLPDEERITSFGRWLRKFSLDELPQFINVLKGDMSIIGPRPLLMEYLPLYNKKQKKRHCVKPGITGWAQVNGRNAVSWEQKFNLDIWYVENWTLILDLKIILLTLIKVLKREGISGKGCETMEKFEGSKEELGS
jgi:sugar transferase EpsL